jgi:hypothetical protein
MDELDLGSLVGMLVGQLGVVFQDHALPENAQVVVRPIYTWPDGKPGLWIVVNWPN